jgi:hypothetical protein
LIAGRLEPEIDIDTVLAYSGDSAVPAGTWMKDSRARGKIDALVAHFFSVFDNRDGAVPQLADLIDCFTEKATIVRRYNAGADVYTVDEFALPRIELLTQGSLIDFHEREISSTTQIFDGIATRTSLYGKSGLLNGNDYSGSGTNAS